MGSTLCQQSLAAFLHVFPKVLGQKAGKPLWNEDKPVKPLDRFLQRWRMARARPYLQRDCRLLDIGCHDGEFLDFCDSLLAPSVGIDPLLSGPRQHGRHQLLPYSFPCSEFAAGSYDAISMLAVLEHFPAPQLSAVVQECERLLVPAGRVILTVPSPLVDHILALLRGLRLIDGMSLEEHYGFQPAQVVPLFSPPFQVLRTRRFQLGLNHLFVFEKPRGIVAD